MLDGVYPGALRTVLRAPLLVVLATAVLGYLAAQRTRTLAATVTYETRRGEFGRAMACGILLLVLAVGTALLAHRLSREARS